MVKMCPVSWSLGVSWFPEMMMVGMFCLESLRSCVMAWLIARLVGLTESKRSPEWSMRSGLFCRA